MKRYREILTCVLIPMIVSFTGCLDISVRTTVSEDGSSERVISMKSGMKTIPPEAFPVPTDSTWSVEWRETGEKETRYEYIARKRFATPEDLHREYSRLPDTDAVGISVSIDKRFEWFYTYMDYRETYVRREPAKILPLSDFMSKEEIELYIYGNTSDSLKKKIKEWDNRNLFEQLFRPLVAEAEKRGDTSLPASLLMEKKEELFQAVMEADSAGKKGDKKGNDSSKGNIDTPEGLLRVFADVLRTDAIMKFQPIVDRFWNEIEKDVLGGKKTPDGWTCSLQMPGLLIETNSTTVQGNTMTWKFDSDQLRAGDYTMRASSRIANVWAFVITGIAALLIVLMGIGAAFRRRLPA